MGHSNPTISSILIAPTVTANALLVGDIINGIGIPFNSEVLSINNIGGDQWEITINQTPNSTDVYETGNHQSYSDPSGADDGRVAWPTSLTITSPSEDTPTLSFREDVRGWVSFKSFTPENAISMANDYYTFKNGGLWKHHDETVDRNTFYNIFVSSSVEVVFNDSPSSIKDFQTLNYEGSQSKIGKFVYQPLNLAFQPLATYNNQEIYNLEAKDGWYVDKIFTDKEEGRVNEFVEKEGKWYNNINRLIDVSLDSADTADFTFQGIGSVGIILGCTNPAADNYNPNADVDDGSCLIGGSSIVLGCTNPVAINYNASANVDDGSCLVMADPDIGFGSIDSGDPVLVSVDDDAVFVSSDAVLGCTNPLASNYDPNANVDDGSCLIMADPDIDVGFDDGDVLVDDNTVYTDVDIEDDIRGDIRVIVRDDVVSGGCDPSQSLGVFNNNATYAAGSVVEYQGTFWTTTSIHTPNTGYPGSGGKWVFCASGSENQGDSSGTTTSTGSPPSTSYR